MRRKDREITSRQEIEQLLKQCHVCRLAMVDGDKPYIVPLNFGYRDGTLFFHCAKQGRKLDLIRKNPNICFEMDQLVKLKKAQAACEWGVEYKSIIGSGRAQLVDDATEKTEALHIIMAQYSDRSFEFPDKELEKTMVIKVVIDEMTGKQS